MLPTISQTVRYSLMMSLALACLLAGASAQGLTGQISGTLTDPQGGVVSGVKVEVINEETAQTRAVNTDSDGNFVVTQLLRCSDDTEKGADQECSDPPGGF